MNVRQGMRAGLIRALITVLVTVIPAAAEEDGSSVFLPVDESELLVLQVRAERYLASEGIVGFLYDDKVLLPLGELAASLEYAIISYPSRGLVEGWLVEEDRVFRLDLNAQAVTFNDRQQGIEWPCLYVNDQDVYVTSEVLSTWWPLDIEIDLSRLNVDIIPRETVPLLNRLQREREWAQFSLRSQPEEAVYPRHRAPYRLVSWPFLDASIAGIAGDRRTEGRGSVLARGDLARLSTMGFVGWDSRRPDPWYFWLRAGRTERDGSLLGPLGATSYDIGDVTSVALPLVGMSHRGRGAAISNRLLGSTSQFDAVDVHGEAPPGWEVELYLGGSLYAIQTASAEGYYRFDRVPLHVGLNTLRTIIYGPSGQTREQVRTYNILSGMRPTGTLQYDYSSLQIGKSLLGQEVSDAGVIPTGSWQHQLALRYGLRPATTVGLAYNLTDTDSTRHHYAVAQLLQTLGPVFMQAAAAKDIDAGQAASIGLQSMVGPRSLHLGYERYDDFHSLGSRHGSGLYQQKMARLHGVLGRSRTSGWAYRLEWNQEDYTGQEVDQVTSYGVHLGGPIGRLNIGHNLAHRRHDGIHSARSTGGQTFVAGFYSGVRLSGRVGYRFGEDHVFDSAGGTAGYAFTTRLQGLFSGQRVFTHGGLTTLMGRLDWNLRPIRLGMQASKSGSSWSVGVSASSSIMRAPETGDWVVSSRPLAGHGAALVQAFIDRNRNGVYDGQDEPLPDVRFRGNQLWDGIATAEDGKAFLPGLPANQFVNVRVDYSSVAEPYLVPAYPAMTTLVHAGGVSDLRFPFHYVGEIEGMVARGEELNQPMRNIGLELIDDEGERQASAVSEFDGYYLFQDVAPGEYLLQVVKGTLRGQPLVIPDPVRIVIPPNGGFVHGPTIILAPPRDPVEDDEPALVALVTPASPEPVSTPPARPAEPQIPVPVVHPPVDKTPPVEVPPTVAVVSDVPPAQPAAAATVEPGLSADHSRTLHLIYELLYESRLLAGTRP